MEKYIEPITDVYKLFLNNFTNKIIDMSNTQQGQSIAKPSPYHLEGDVWSHTLCAFQHIPYILNDMNIDPDDIIVRQSTVAVLMHDIGKIVRRAIKENGNVSFYGHDNDSMQYILDNHKIISSVFDLCDNEIIQIMLAIQVHTVYYKLNHAIDIAGYLNHDEQLVKLFKILTAADSRGQIRDNEIFNNKNEFNLLNIPTNDFLNKKIDNNFERTITLMVGCPASGKDYIAEKYFKSTNIFSFDDIRVEEYLKYVPELNKSDYNEVYSNAFKWCCDERIDLNMHLVKKIKKSFDDGLTNVVISNTSLNKKSRKYVFGIAKNFKCKVNCVCVLSDLNTLLLRDANRVKLNKKGKSVGFKVIKSMFDRQFLPTYAENFNDIKYIFND